MKGKSGIDVGRLAAATGGEIAGRVSSGPGWFGALALADEVRARFQTPAGGGRATDPRWTERRLVPFAPSTLELLGAESRRLTLGGAPTSPFQIAAVLIERGLAAAREPHADGWRNVADEIERFAMAESGTELDLDLEAAGVDQLIAAER